MIRVALNRIGLCPAEIKGPLEAKINMDSHQDSKEHYGGEEDHQGEETDKELSPEPDHEGEEPDEQLTPEPINPWEGRLRKRS